MPHPRRGQLGLADRVRLWIMSRHGPVSPGPTRTALWRLICLRRPLTPRCFVLARDGLSRTRAAASGSASGHRFDTVRSCGGWCRAEAGSGATRQRSAARLPVFPCFESHWLARRHLVRSVGEVWNPVDPGTRRSGKRGQREHGMAGVGPGRGHGRWSVSRLGAADAAYVVRVVVEPSGSAGGARCPD